MSTLRPGQRVAFIIIRDQNDNSEKFEGHIYDSSMWGPCVGKLEDVPQDIMGGSNGAFKEFAEKLVSEDDLTVRVVKSMPFVFDVLSLPINAASHEPT